MKTDEAIEAVRAVRAKISQESGHDPAKLIARYIELQKQQGGPILPGPEADVTAAQPKLAPDESSGSVAGSRR